VKAATHSGGKFTTFQVISGIPKEINNHPFPFKKWIVSPLKQYFGRGDVNGAEED
jgi:hypothetical protein